MSILAFGVFVCLHVTTRDPMNTFSCDLMSVLLVKYGYTYTLEIKSKNKTLYVKIHT
jgi:hypothetical protein